MTATRPGEREMPRRERSLGQISSSRFPIFLRATRHLDQPARGRLPRCASTMAKGVSAAEKKERMLKLFRESKDVFTKKEIESRSTKAGIISNAVEGVLKELVGDDLVREEKVGISTYWWSFPGEDAAKKRRELSEQQAAVAELTPKLEQLQQQQASATAAAGGEGDASELQALETSIDALRGRQKAASEELTKLTKHGT